MTHPLAILPVSREVFEYIKAKLPEAGRSHAMCDYGRLIDMSGIALAVEEVPGPNGGPAMTDHILQFFEYAHLPEPLQAVSRPFCLLAHDLVATLPRNPERTVALRKLLEAKDAAVRAKLAQEPV